MVRESLRNQKTSYLALLNYKFIKRLWEKDIKIDKVPFFNIGGFAKDYKDLIIFMLRMEDIPGSGEIWLNSITKDQITGENIDGYSFNISVFWDLKPYEQEITSRSSGQEQEDTQEQESQASGQ